VAAGERVEGVVVTRAQEGEAASGSGGGVRAEGGVSEAGALALSPPQRTAIERLTSEQTVVSSAAAAGVSRSTLHRWMKEDATFQAAYNAWQRDALVTARGRLLALTERAVTAVEKAMEKGDGRLAMRLLEKMGLTDPPKPGPTEVEEVRREQARDKRRVEVEGEEGAGPGADDDGDVRGRGAGRSKKRAVRRQ
jgi:hypothetical protein